MSYQIPSRTLTAAVLLAGSLALALACGQRPSPPSAVAAPPPATKATPASRAFSSPATLGSIMPAAAPAASVVTPTSSDGVTFTGTREETERFITYHKTIQLTAEQERTKVEALSAIPAPCCSDNSLATCCCPCNMAKAAWGMSAWLITEKGYGAEEVRQAAKDWLAVANPDGFSGDVCYTGRCNQPIHDNGCGGMDDRKVL